MAWNLTDELSDPAPCPASFFYTVGEHSGRQERGACNRPQDVQFH